MSITSKRKLRQLVEQGIVSGWDDPRMPTIVGIRRRGYTPESIQLFCERIGVTKSDGWIDYSTLEGCLREDLDPKAPRATAVLRPLKLVIDNFPDDLRDACSAPIHPHHPERGLRQFNISKELWIEQEDFMEVPSKGYFRLFPGQQGAAALRLRGRMHRLRQGRRRQCDRGALQLLRRQQVRHRRQRQLQGQGQHPLGQHRRRAASRSAPVRPPVYRRQPDAGGKDFMTLLNPNALEVVQAYLEPGMKHAQPDERFQFERHGYFVADRVDSVAGKPVFNRVTTLKDSWGK